MQQSRIDFKKLRSVISLQYGIELDETSLAILAILTQEVQQQFKAIRRTQDEMATQIQYSKKALQVDPEHPRWQAFWHGMGQWGLGLCLAVIVALTIYCFNLNKIREEKQAAQQELAWYKEHCDAAKKASAKTGAGAVGKKPRQKNK